MQSFWKDVQNKLRKVNQNQQALIPNQQSISSTIPENDHQYIVQFPLNKQGRLQEKIESISLSNFIIGPILGIGSYGKVKLVMQKHNEQRQFALKMLKKIQILSKNQIEHIKNEKNILMKIQHPFIINLKTTFQDNKYLYMLMDYVPGGQLFTRLRKEGRFSNDVALFYMTQIVHAINYMHNQFIVFRDLKPQNLLLDRNGNIIITDFGFAKVIATDKTYTICGTPQYLAPQIIKSSNSSSRLPYGKSCDWWALGILLFQMLTGFPPFFDHEDPSKIYEKVELGIIEFPKFLDVKTKNLIRKLLNPEPKKRLGSNDVLLDNQNGESIMKHRWFRGVEWQKVFNKQVPSPWIPNLKSLDDISNFQKYNQIEDPMQISQDLQYNFEDF